jgi:hypothetical protein
VLRAVGVRRTSRSTTPNPITSQAHGSIDGESLPLAGIAPGTCVVTGGVVVVGAVVVEVSVVGDVVVLAGGSTVMLSGTADDAARNDASPA